MNYQLMFQTIAILCGIATVIMAMGWVFDDNNNSRRIIWAVVILFIITVISGALAAGLS